MGQILAWIAENLYFANIVVFTAVISFTVIILGSVKMNFFELSCTG